MGGRERDVRLEEMRRRGEGEGMRERGSCETWREEREGKGRDGGTDEWKMVRREGGRCQTWGEKSEG